MKILHIVADISAGSGVAVAATRLAVEQQNLSHQVCVACTGERGEVLKCESSKVLKLGESGVRVVTFRRNWPRFILFSWGMLLGLGKMVKDVDVVHVHSNWTFPVWWGAWLALRQKKTLVMSPHGCFDPVRLEHSGWKKRLVGWIDRWLLRRASVVHATCEEEKRWVQAFLKCANARMRECANGGGIPRQGEADPRRPKIVVIPNGVEKF
jgi:glycosyltransferase involved in cell wall biosynthesis